jgi:uncharacterized surface protein with fasciclin (FAS1) repeats
MNHRRTAAALATAAVTALGVVGAAPAATAGEHASGERSLAQVLAADGNRFDRNLHDFDILDRAVTTVLSAKPASPVAVLADGSTRLTAFAPTDLAFKRLVNQITGSWPKSEKQAFNRLAGAAGVDTVETVLLYHVVPGATVTYRQALRADGAKLQTAQGSSIKVDVRRCTVVLKDADRNDWNPRVVRSLRDVNKGNKQIAHGIDRVLRPIDLP